jgi:hypothetical protein
MGNADVVVVSAIGTSTTGIRVNDGANFGPDTSGTTTNGIQEALNAISSGGTVFVRKGDYTLTSPIFNTGNNQTVIFEAGCSLTFSSSGSYANWNSDIVDIWVGCNFTTSANKSSTNTFNNVSWHGNGCTITCSGLQTAPNGEVVFGIIAYLSSSLPAPNYKVILEGFTANGFGGAALMITNGAAASGATIADQWRRVVIRDVDATMASNSASSPYGSGIILSGCNGVEVVDCAVDTSQTGSGADTSNCFLSSNRGGDTQTVVFRRCRFNSRGTGTNPGSVIECQGSTNSHGSTHDILWEDCNFQTTSAGNPLGGAGGAYIDDTDGAGGGGRVYNLEWRRCQWINAGMSFSSTGSQNGFILFDGGQLPGAISGILSGRTIQVASITPGLYTAALRVAVPKGPGYTTLATYTPPVTLQFTVSAYVSAVAADTPSIQVLWTDPDTGTAQTATVLNAAIVLDGTASASISIVAKASTAITIQGFATTSGTSLIASVSVNQAQ